MNASTHLRFPCPRCGKPVQTPGGYAGKAIRCPYGRCRQTVRVPTAGGTSSPTAPPRGIPPRTIVIGVAAVVSVVLVIAGAGISVGALLLLPRGAKTVQAPTPMSPIPRAVEDNDGGAGLPAGSTPNPNEETKKDGHTPDPTNAGAEKAGDAAAGKKAGKAPDGEKIAGSDGGWLTDPERDFFASLGVDSQVDGKPVKRFADLARLPDIARWAPQPLRARIEAIAQAREDMKVTPKEMADFDELLRSGIAEAQKQVQLALVRAVFSDDDALTAAVDATNAMMKNAKVVDAWRIQRQWLERGLAARRDADAQLAAITDDLEHRAGRTRPIDDLALNLVVDGRQLRVEGKVSGISIRDPIIQVILWKKSTRGMWTGANVLSGLTVRAMGVTAMDGGAQTEGGRLAIAQEKAMNLPLIATVLLPSLNPGGFVSVSLGLPAEAVQQIERVEVRLWSAEGSFAVKAVPGLSKTQEEVAEKPKAPVVNPSDPPASDRANLSKWCAIAYSETTGNYGWAFGCANSIAADANALRNCNNPWGAKVIVRSEGGWCALAIGHGGVYASANGSTAAEAKEKALSLLARFSARARIAVCVSAETGKE